MPNAPSTEWDVNGWGDPSIQGFGHDISIDLGETILFKIMSDSTHDRIDIYRMGWYAGLGARLVDTVAPSVPLPQSQPEGLRDPATRLHDCGNWAVSASWTAPKDAVSGIYFARLVHQDPEPEPAPWRADHSLTPPAARPEAVAHAYGSLGHGRLRIALCEPRASHIYFIVRDDPRQRQDRPDARRVDGHLTTIDNVPYVQDCGSVFDSGTATHHLTLYRHASGALVFGAGTVQWAWGLDAHHDTETGVPPERVNENTTRVGVDPNGPDQTVRQATVNLFADMGVQPATLAPDLVRAEASDDREPPVSRIDEPRTGSSLPPDPVQVSGASHDRGGGCVAAIEVSVDGGATWHRVEGREAWRYEWKPEGSGTWMIPCRAVDDSGNLEAPAAGERHRHRIRGGVRDRVRHVLARGGTTSMSAVLPWTSLLRVMLGLSSMNVLAIFTEIPIFSTC